MDFLHEDTTFYDQIVVYTGCCEVVNCPVNRAGFGDGNYHGVLGSVMLLLLEHIANRVTVSFI